MENKNLLFRLISYGDKLILQRRKKFLFFKWWVDQGSMPDITVAIKFCRVANRFPPSGELINLEELKKQTTN